MIAESNGAKQPPHAPDEIVGNAPALLRAMETARHCAPTDMSVLIVGETGTGKELLARYVHRHSGRNGELVDIDCGALPEELVEASLFGHRRGAFTGAIEDSQGLVAEADGGTLFLDELGSLSRRAQAKLLRVIETRRVRRVGEARSRRVQFRTVATAQPSIVDLVAGGEFREDLFYRVAGTVIELPALRERVSDIPALASHFGTHHGLRITDGAATWLAERAWPGNVRQLERTIDRCACVVTDGLIDIVAVRTAMATGPTILERNPPSHDRNGSVTELIAVCRKHSGRPDPIAQELGVSPATLYRRLKVANLELASFRGAPGAP